MAIVCGTDFSARAAPGVSAAGALAQGLRDSGLVLVNAVERGSSEAAALKRLEQEAAWIAERWKVPVRCVAAQGEPVEVLLREALRRRALLVVSCAGHGERALIHVGGTAERAAESAQVPTLLVHDAAPFEEWVAGSRSLVVVLGVGDGAADDAALSWVRQLRLGGPCNLIAATVYDLAESLVRYGLARVGSLLDPDPRLERLIERNLAAWVGDIGGEGTVGVRAISGLGRRGDHLLEFSSAQEADLLVVGAHAKGWLKRLSSVSSVALHWRHSSVACIPAGETKPLTPHPIRRVLVATDLSPAGDRALPEAVALLGDDAGEIQLVYVAESEAPGADSKLRDLAAATLHSEKVKVTPEVIQSRDPAQAICAAAERIGADVVCIGRHGHSLLLKRTLGSIAGEVLRQCRRPVLVVPPP